MEEITLEVLAEGASGAQWKQGMRRIAENLVLKPDGKKRRLTLHCDVWTDDVGRMFAEPLPVIVKLSPITERMRVCVEEDEDGWFLAKALEIELTQTTDDEKSASPDGGDATDSAGGEADPFGPLPEAA